MYSFFKNFIKKVLKAFGYEIRLYRISIAKNKQSINRILSEDCRKIHYACGNILFKDWVNVDLQPIYEKDHLIFSMDLIKPHPFPDNFFQFGYSEDFIEHLSQADSLLFFLESYRTLQPNGVLRLSFPVLENIITKDFAKINYSTCFKNNFEIYDQWGHLHFYSKEEIAYVLKRIGFKEISFLECGQSNYKELKGIDTRIGQSKINVYLEAIK